MGFYNQNSEKTKQGKNIKITSLHSSL